MGHRDTEWPALATSRRPDFEFSTKGLLEAHSIALASKKGRSEETVSKPSFHQDLSLRGRLPTVAIQLTSDGWPSSADYGGQARAEPRHDNLLQRVLTVSET